MLGEPTNDLDTDTLAALEDLLDTWAGTLIVVSHDRYLIERVTDTVLALPGDGTLVHRPGGVEQYLTDRRAASAGGAGPRSAGAAAQAVIGSVGNGAGGLGGAGDAATAVSAGPGPAELRRLRKDLLRSGERLESLRRKQSTLHEKLAAVGADYAAAAELNEQLRAVQDELDATEAQWLEIAERIEG